MVEVIIGGLVVWLLLRGKGQQPSGGSASSSEPVTGALGLLGGEDAGLAFAGLDAIDNTFLPPPVRSQGSGATPAPAAAHKAAQGPAKRAVKRLPIQRTKRRPHAILRPHPQGPARGFRREFK